MVKDIRCNVCNWLNKEVLNGFKCRNCGKQNGEYKEQEKVEQPKQIEVKKNIESDWLKEVANIKGIGKETVDDLGMIYSSREEFITALNSGRVPIRNDMVKLLKEYFNEVERR